MNDIFNIRDTPEEKEKKNNDLGKALGINKNITLEGGVKVPEKASNILRNSTSPATLAEMSRTDKDDYAHDRRLKDQTKKLQDHNGQISKFNLNNARDALKMPGRQYYSKYNEDDTLNELNNGNITPEVLDPEHKGLRLSDKEYNNIDKKYQGAFNAIHGEGDYADKVNAVAKALGKRKPIVEKVEEINEIAPEIDAHKEGNDIKLDNGNTVEDALEQAEPEVKDTPKEDKTQKQEEEMARDIAQPKGILGAGLKNLRDGKIPPTSDERPIVPGQDEALGMKSKEIEDDKRATRQVTLPIRKTKPNSDYDSHALGLDIPEEEYHNWDWGKASTADDFANYLNTLYPEEAVEEAIESNPEEAKEDLTGEIKEEAEQIGAGDKRDDEVRNDVVNEAIKKKPEEIGSFLNKKQGTLKSKPIDWDKLEREWEEERNKPRPDYKDEFGREIPDYQKWDEQDAIRESRIEPDEELDEDVFDPGLEDLNQYQDSVDLDDTVVDPNMANAEVEPDSSFEPALEAPYADNVVQFKKDEPTKEKKEEIKKDKVKKDEVKKPFRLPYSGTGAVDTGSIHTGSVTPMQMNNPVSGRLGSAGRGMFGSIPTYGSVSAGSVSGGGSKPNSSVQTQISRASGGAIPPKVNESNGRITGGSNNNNTHSNGSVGSGRGMLLGRRGGNIAVNSSNLPVMQGGHTSGIGDIDVPNIGGTSSSGNVDPREMIINVIETKLNELNMERPEVIEQLDLDHLYKHWSWQGIALDELNSNQLSELNEILDKVS